MSETVHATTVSIGGRGVLISGPSGAGKSDLALRLIDRGALLVSDDYTVLARDGEQVYADAPATIAGRLEVRGVGIVAMPPAGRTRVSMAVRLGEPERLPEPAWRRLLGLDMPEVTIAPREAAAPLKVELALRELAR